MGDINWKNKCWVTTIYLVNSEKKVLLTWNKNVQTWIPVGGHIDPGETPVEAIKREVAEEIGFDFEFVHDKESLKDGDVDIIPLYRVHLDYPQHHGTHINFVFIGKCNSFSRDKNETDEEEKIRWFSEEELIKEKDNFLTSVWNSAMNALKIVNGS